MPNSKEWQRFQSHLGTKLLDAPAPWAAVIKETESIIRQYSHKGKLGTADMIFVASAIEGGAKHFLSFDTNSNLRALAAVLKLKVFPDLTAEDKRRMAVFR